MTNQYRWLKRIPKCCDDTNNFNKRKCIVLKNAAYILANFSAFKS